MSHSGSALLAELADRLGLTQALGDAMADTRMRRSAHDPGAVLCDLAVMLADGGDSLSDLGALRDQQALFGPVASARTAWRTIAAVDDAHLGAIRAARAVARERAWAAGARPDRLILDIDATLVTSHSDKQDAAPTYRRGFGFHPLLCYLDGSQEALAGILRPGNAGANTAADHIAVLIDALAQLPGGVGEHPAGHGILVRADSAGASHAFLDAIADMGMSFSVGFDLTAPVRAAVLALSEGAWSPALTQAGEIRQGACVAEIFPDLRGWPPGTRAICRRERPHPGAQLTFSDADGHRFQVFITNQAGEDVALFERCHRAHARVEDRIRAAKDTGLRNLPFRAFAPNCLWLELVLIAEGPDQLGPDARSLRRSGARRAQTASLPPAPRGRPDHPLGSAGAASPAGQLALGQGARGRLRAAASASRAGRVAAEGASEDQQVAPGARRAARIRP